MNKESTFDKVYQRIMGKPLNGPDEQTNTASAIIDDIVTCIKENATFSEDKKVDLIEFINNLKK